jgi:hypothetical protein
MRALFAWYNVALFLNKPKEVLQATGAEPSKSSLYFLCLKESRDAFRAY